MTTRLLAIACTLATAGAAAAQSRPEAVVQTGHLDPIISAGFSADGRLVATVSEDKTTRVWHVETGALLHTFPGPAGGVRAVAFRPDDREVVTGGDSRLYFRDVPTGQVLRSVGNQVNVVYALAYSRDSDLLAVAGSHTKVTVLDANTGKSRETLSGLGDGVNCLAFSERGKGHRLATGDEDGEIRVWNALGDKPVHTFPKAHTTPKAPKGKERKNYERGVLALDFSPDGELLASAGADGKARVWDAINFEPLPELAGLAGRVTGVGFVGPELLLTTGHGGAVRFWHARTGEPADPQGGAFKADFEIDKSLVSPDGRHLLLISGSRGRLFAVDAGTRTVTPTRHLAGVRDRGYSAAISPDGTAIAVGSRGEVALWRPGSASPLVTLRGHEGPVFALAFSPNSKLLATVATVADGERCFVRTYDVATGRLIDSDFAHAARTLSVAFSPDGSHLATASHDAVVRVWKVGPRGRLLDDGFKLSAPKRAAKFHAVAFSPDGKLLAAGADGRVIVWELAGRNHWHTFADGGDWYSVAFGRDGALAAGNDHGETSVWDLGTKQRKYPTLNPNPKEDKIRPENHVYGLAYSPDGKYLVTAHGRAVHAWDAATGTHLARFPAHLHIVRSVGFTADGRFLLSASGDIEAFGDGDGQAKLWEFNREKNPLPARASCTLVSFWAEARRQENWAVIDHAGRYDASGAGEVPWLHFVVDNEPVALTQLKDRYYEPHLLAKVLGLDPENPRAVKALAAPKLPPKATLAQQKGTTAVTIKLADQGGGVGRVQVLVNDRELVADARPAKPGGDITVDLSKVPLRGKGDAVRVVAWNADGTVAGRGATLDLAALGPPPASRKPELHAVVVGVSKFANPRIDLQYAAKDAEDFAAALRVGGQRLFGAQGVHLTLLTNPGPRAATRENIEAAFKEVARAAHPDDVFLVFFAGHGVTIPEQELYCYLTADATTTNPAALAVPAARGTVVTSEDLVEWMRPIRADRHVLILDTCAAGGAGAKLVPSSQVRAVERLKDRTGFHVLMGCAADKVSYEANRLQHGLLTYSLLEGMQGAGIRSGDRVDVTEWFRHAWYMVPKLAEGVGGVQQPLIRAPHGNPFDVAQFTDAERRAIKLPQPAPRLCRPRLAGPTGGDGLGLEEKVEAALSACSAPRGDPLTFIPCENLANAYRPVGVYEVKGKQVIVTLRLEWNGREVARLDPVKGTKDRPDLLARDVAAALLKWGATARPER